MPTWQQTRARELRANMTEAERRLWQVLRERQLDGFKFRRQQPLGRYIVDFICLSARLIVEVDGGHHGEDLDGERDHWLRAQAFTVLRLWNNDINDNLEGAYAHIEAALKKPFDDQTQSPWAKSKFSSRAGHPHPTPPQPDGPADERSASREPFDRKRAGSPPVRGDGREHEHRRDLHGDAAGGSDETLLDHTPADAPISASRERRNAELRVYGLNAIHAVYARRPEAIRKLYLSENRIQALGPLLRWCVANRVGYRVVDDADLQKLAASSHHEGVVADVLRAEPGPLSQWLRELPAGPQCALWLDGVGNPHNLGAILRSAAHFGVAAVLLPKHSPLTLSGAAARVAEGGAEAVPFVRLGRSDNAIAQLRSVGFALAATVVQGGSDLFATPLPERVVYVLGAESQGMDRELVTMCDLRLSIPGSGAVESLNVAAATAVLLAAWRARR